MLTSHRQPPARVTIPDASLLLSPEEVELLEEGSTVYIAWQGESRGELYYVGRINGWTYAYRETLPFAPLVKRHIRLVGKERFNTKVWLA